MFVKKIWDETSMFKEHKLFNGLRKNWVTYCLYDLNCVWKYIWLALHSQLLVRLFLARHEQISIDPTQRATTEQRNNVIKVQLGRIVSLFGVLKEHGWGIQIPERVSLRQLRHQNTPHRQGGCLKTSVALTFPSQFVCNSIQGPPLPMQLFIYC